jgi:hypothetical protein
MEIAVKMAETSSEGRGQRRRCGTDGGAGDSPAAGIMGSAAA